MDRIGGDIMKKVIKYTANILAVINALLIGINAVDGITIPYCVQITGVISAIIGVLSGGLLGTKVVNTDNTTTELTKRQLKKIYGEIPVEPDELETAPVTHEEGEE